MKIDRANQRYEHWLVQRMPLVPKDLRLKHALMKRDGFSFLRATFYRWMQRWPVVCADLATAPVVLAVGDLHVENFGTWRDQEGRLIWGINDFDEAYKLPYTNDLVRLAVSAKLAFEADQLALKPRDACDAILTGYMEGLRLGGEPFVLSERHPWLRDIATNSLRDPVRFWRNMQALPLVKGAIPQSARKALQQLMPEPGLSYRVRHRVSGLGSLGRPRYVALAEWQGGAIAREAKAMAPSACVWARDGEGESTILYQSMLDHAVRSRDPFVQIQGGWLVRRLSPYCSRIALASLPKKRDENRLLYAMGWETANVHLGSQNIRRVLRRDLANRKAKWLRVATKAMTNVTMSDWKDWVRG
ncbi:MAG TPA: DUF2252 family protein [Nitrospiraceae bacterium]|nr:DUF2252 family protein [Nitrospiraceae bacterium]